MRWSCRGQSAGFLEHYCELSKERVQQRLAVGGHHRSGDRLGDVMPSRVQTSPEEAPATAVERHAQVVEVP